MHDWSGEDWNGERREKEGGMYLDEQRRWGCVSYSPAFIGKAELYVLPERRIEQDRRSRDYYLSALSPLLPSPHLLTPEGRLAEIDIRAHNCC